MKLAFCLTPCIIQTSKDNFWFTRDRHLLHRRLATIFTKSVGDKSSPLGRKLFNSREFLSAQWTAGFIPQWKQITNNGKLGRVYQNLQDCNAKILQQIVTLFQTNSGGILMNTCYNRIVWPRMGKQSKRMTNNAIDCHLWRARVSARVSWDCASRIELWP